MEHHPIIVSQDCGHEQTAEVIRSYGNQIKFIQQPDLSPIVIDGHVKNKLLTGYYKISRHYKWALSQVFDVFNYKAVIVVEDDLDISVDFYEYFTATRHVLEEDPTLWCVSAWNDNGKQNFIDTTRPDLLYRSDFFPGLGWMLTVSVWNEMRDRWPKAFWDDWMRESAQRKGRACIRPEIPRTDTFGRIGVSRGQFFDKHLKFIVLNSQPVSFNDKDMSYLMKDTYDRQFYSEVYHTPLVSADQLLSGSVDRTVRVEYKNNAEFMQLAQRIGIMADLKDFVPRTAYKGVVSFMFHSHRVYLTRPEGRTEHYTDKPKIRVA
ncbi:alpha-1,3-mannosyl-glycoprotein 2-beta-N-acetylglucosaminyltransferase-like [Corticium candelabrum]|uniref:alpha-1,3-mannosyl-glycoprotein 2-beta-N-acetylglucosaminyltransferase-like n=1 Tax=Corticium candelabrum TaxID=121492 RepID=UPI002E2595FA|nr:alpha-1,3-mannosyl-glycoprotein 2-beta-N-acetylglucosaminyltransferase-like [Corticium candelabrum]